MQLKIFQPDQPIPSELKSNFFHLVMDIFWFGVINGTSMSFISIYIARIGGSERQLGLLGAVPAIITILFSLPFGTWLQHRDTAREVVLASIYYRLFYLLWIPIPALFIQHTQVTVLLGLTFAMAIPGVILQVGFNDLFADAVPVPWRGYVAGIRNAALAIMSVVISLIGGQVLTRVIFPINYQILFAIGFIGAAMSSLHLWFIWKNLKKSKVAVLAPESGQIVKKKTTLREYLLPDFKALQQGGGKHFFIVMLGLFGFHLGQYLPMPVFPYFNVNILKLSDQMISLGNGLFFGLVFLTSTQIARWASKTNTKIVLGVGVMLMSLYPTIISLGHSVTAFLIACAIGGFAWGLAGGILYTYLLEKIPENNRPPYLAFYNLAFNIAVLIGSTAGPAISNLVGINNALLLFGIIRLASGIFILRKG